MKITIKLEPEDANNIERLYYETKMEVMQCYIGQLHYLGG